MAALLPIEARSGTMGGKNIKGGRKLSEPDVDEMDMSLFREHEEGFPGRLFFEDTEGQEEMQQHLPQWRQAGKSKGGGGWKSKKCKKSRRNLQTTGKGGKGSKKCTGGAPSPWSGGSPGNPSSPAFPTSPTWPTLPMPVTPPTPTSPVMVPSMPVLTPVSVPVVAPVGAPVAQADNSGPTGNVGRDWDANSAVCSAIAQSSNKKSGGPSIAFNDLSVDVDLDLRVRSKNALAVAPLLDDYSKFVRLYTLGCFEEASDELSSVQSRRKLITEPLFQATMNSWFEDGTTCTGTSTRTCDYKNSIWVYYQNNGNSDPDEYEIKERVREALSVIAQALEQHPDVDDVAVDTVAVSAAKGSNSDGSATAAGTYVGVTAAALALFLLLMFLAKRNRDSDEVSHLKFVDDEDTYVNEFDGKNADSDSDADGRRVHVVGESDSVMSGWTGYSVDDTCTLASDSDQSGKLGHTMGDVHICSSATCELCERRRQMGVTFVKTSSPPMPERPALVPRDATREYVAEDVVAL